VVQERDRFWRYEGYGEEKGKGSTYATAVGKKDVRARKVSLQGVNFPSRKKMVHAVLERMTLPESERESQGRRGG